jgi:diaminopimelate decarboxylase
MPNPLAPSWRHEPTDPNALHSGIWPAGAVRDAAGELVIGGVSAHDLVSSYGTPVLVMDKDDMLIRAHEVLQVVQAATAKHGVTGSVYYASKSFISGHVVGWLADAGLGFDVASGGELAIALAGGADPRHIEFQGNNKSGAEIHQAVSAGVGTIVLDAPIEAERVALAASELGVVQDVMVRVNTGVHADTHEYLATAREDQKFGLSPAEATALVAQLRQMPALRFVGLHSHIGSQIFAVEGFLEAATRMVELYAELLRDGPIESLNLGGGFGIAYSEADSPMEITTMITQIVDHVATEASRHGVAMPHLSFEPGRVISGPAGVTLYSAGVVKPVSVSTEGGGVATRLYVSVDGGMSDNARPALYGAHYSTRIASRVSKAPSALVRVVGKHCESGDIVVNADYLPGDVTPGDLIAVATTGAYCYSLASNYNQVARPPVVWVSQGQHGLMVAGETLKDVLARDHGLHHQG